MSLLGCFHALGKGSGRDPNANFMVKVVLEDMESEWTGTEWPWSLHGSWSSPHKSDTHALHPCKSLSLEDVV